MEITRAISIPIKINNHERKVWHFYSKSCSDISSTILDSASAKHGGVFIMSFSSNTHKVANPLTCASPIATPIVTPIATPQISTSCPIIEKIRKRVNIQKKKNCREYQYRANSPIPPPIPKIQIIGFTPMAMGAAA